MLDMNKIATDTPGDPQDAIESGTGEYKPNVDPGSTVDSRLPTTQMPQAPDPSPFTLGSK